MYTSEQIAAELVKWSEARQKIRTLEPVDFTTNHKSWKAHHAAIDAVEALSAMLLTLAEDLEADAQSQRDLLDRIEQQSYSEWERFNPAGVDRDQELTPCPFCNARVHTTESGELVNAVELTRIGNGYDAECLECGKAWGVLPDDPEWPK